MTDPAARFPLYYTFGNHMHWVDMEWLWGYSTLPGSARDMLAYIRQSGARGQINFDGIGYEKLAVQAPEVIAELRTAVEAGQVEISGASYGQPYGLFHGGESNVRQRVYGARTVRRLFGVWPRTFWEEEFDFFPQLPQILAGTGFEYASLFFQWTWHTPVLPLEEAPAIWWEGLDGSRLLTSPRGRLNLHQWPEEFAGLLADPALPERGLQCLVQWLELMPSADWMCRSELILPQIQSLAEDPRIELRHVTLPEFLELARSQAVPRRYTLDDVFHGTSIGKNGDLFRRLSRRGENLLLDAEALSAFVGLFGRPYPSWDVYPTWELEEAWRELLSAQHHDNDECEGLCGFVGRRSYERSMGLSGYVVERTLNLLARRTSGSPARILVYNPLGWTRSVMVREPAGEKDLWVADLPPFGYRVIEPDDCFSAPSGIRATQDSDSVTLERTGLKVVVDRRRGVIAQIFSTQFPGGALRDGQPLGDVCMTRRGQVEHFTSVEVRLEGLPYRPEIRVTRRGREGAELEVRVSLAPELDAVDMRFNAQNLPRPDGRVAAALHTLLHADLASPAFIVDHPYGVSQVHPAGSYQRKYPTGDWMTSPQVYETVHAPFTALHLLDLCDAQRGLLFLHDGSQGFLREGDGARQILSMYDPWDEEYFVPDLDARLRVVPHGPMNHAERWKLAQEFNRPVLSISCRTAARDLPSICAGDGGDLPVEASGPRCETPGVALSAFYREMEEAGRDVPNYAGQGMGYPCVLRLVELNGQPARAELSLPGRAPAVFKTDLLGAVQSRIETRFDPPTPGNPAGCTRLTLDLRANEIATLVVDLELARKVYRNLDERREVWSGAHRVE